MKVRGQWSGGPTTASIQVLRQCQASRSSSLSAFLRIFPTLVFGSSALKYTCFGTLYAESDWRQ